MIERISNQMLVLRPAQGRTEAKKNVSVKVSGEDSKPAEELFNPDFAQKINSSRQSIRDEINLLKDTYQRPKAEKAAPTEAEEPQEQPEDVASYSTLKKSLIRISSLLYQVASAAGGDTETIEQMQRRLVDELREYEGTYTRVDLRGVDLDKMDIAARIDLDQLTPASAAEAQEAVEEAEKELTTATTKSEKTSESTQRSATEAALSTAEQNLAAAESVFYPDEVVDRAHQVSETLTGQMQNVARAQGRVVPEDVLKLIADG